MRHSLTILEGKIMWKVIIRLAVKNMTRPSEVGMSAQATSAVDHGTVAFYTEVNFGGDELGHVARSLKRKRYDGIAFRQAQLSK